MELILSLLLLSSCTSAQYYKIPKSSRQYIMTRQVVGYKCPTDYYYDASLHQCKVDRYSGVIELDSTTLSVNSDVVVMPYDQSNINVRVK